MTDRNLRELERKRNATQGDIAARDRLRTARLRSGVARSGLRCDASRCIDGRVLAPERSLVLSTVCLSCSETGFRPMREGLELAAYCGDEWVRTALGRCVRCGASAPCPCTDHHGTTNRFEITHWIGGFARWDSDVTLRVAAASARAWFSILVPSDWRDRVEVSLMDVERAAATRAWKASPGSSPGWSRGGRDWEPVRQAWLFAHEFSGHETHMVSACLAAAKAITEFEIRAAIRAELVPWVLGEHDPVRARVEARG